MKKFLSDKKHQLYMLMLIWGGVIFLFNCLTPMLADDYTYYFSRITGERMADLKDIVLSMYDHWMTWGGRVITHFIASVFILLPKWIFNIANTVVYLWFTWLLYKFATIHTRKPQPMIYLFVHLGLWLFLPRYGQNILWLIGSCNYLWAATIIITFIWPYYQYALTEKESFGKGKAVLWGIFGVLAGWENENTSGAGILLVVLLLVVCKVKGKKWKPWCVTGLLGQAAGFLLLILAPGNFVRMDGTTESSSFLIRYAGRLSWILQLLTNHLLPLLFLGTIVFVVFCFLTEKKERIVIPAMLFVTAAACHFAMLLSPEYPERALMGTVMFLVIGVLYVVSTLLDQEKQSFKMAVWSLTGCALVYFSIGFLFAFMDIGQAYRNTNRRAEEIIEQREAGERDIVTYKITSENYHNGRYGLYDIEVKANFWTNEWIAKYFEVDTIVSYEE